MITYELAKELKDAGFPQEGLGMHWNGSNFTTNPIFDDELYAPTLSELIKSCEPFKLLENEIGYWRACGGKMGRNESGFEEHGKTPEEAVAKLWLELNKK